MIYLSLFNLILRQFWEKGEIWQFMAVHSIILAWKIPLAEEHDGPESGGHKESDKTERLSVGLSCAFKLFAALLASVQ